MFNLTKQEQWIVAVLVAAMLLGTVVRVWRKRAAGVAPAAKPAVQVENVGSRGR